MKAIGFTQHLNINDSRSLFEFEESVPVPKGHDLLVKVNAVSVNPVDVGFSGRDSILSRRAVICSNDGVSNFCHYFSNQLFYDNDYSVRKF